MFTPMPKRFALRLFLLRYFTISGTVGEDGSKPEVNKSDPNAAPNCYIISVGP